MDLQERGGGKPRAGRPRTRHASNQLEGERLWRSPSLSLSMAKHTPEDTPPLHPPAARGGKSTISALVCTYGVYMGIRPPCTPPAARGGGLLAAAAPPPGRRCPCGRCSSRANTATALPGRWSWPGAATPQGRCSRYLSAVAVGYQQRQQCAALPPQPAPPAWLPLPRSDSPAVGAGCPGTPPAHHPPRVCG